MKAHTLITLLHLRNISELHHTHVSVISEMLDTRNRELATVTDADDFIVSDKLISLMLTQISENKDLMHVFSELFNPEGSEVYLKPAAFYVELDKPVNFYTVVDAAQQRSEVAFGYRLGGGKSAVGGLEHGIRVNPDKSETIAFTAEDHIIVLAED